MDAVTVQGLNKTFKAGFFMKKVHVLKDVSFSIRSQHTYGFVGNNGSGKTTTIKGILQFIKPDSGEVKFFGEPLSIRNKKRIGYLPERPYLYEFLSAMEFLEFHWSLTYDSKKFFKDRAHETLKRVGLFDARDRRLRTFSKGMLQRAGLAQAILHEPELLILDEPMSGLDPDGRILVKEILRDQQKQGRGIFFSSHLLEDMEQLCSHLVVIHQGEIIYQGSIDTVMKDQKSLEEAFKELKLRGTS
jgi:ABC-2 type transport system ATP-binding protein